MLYFICGKIVEIEDTAVIIENNGIGYRLLVSKNTTRKLSVGKETQLYCHLQVREDCLVLYGFSDLAEKNLFSQLTSVSGIGPKNALNILSGMPLNKIMVAIVTSDTSTLCSIKGLGKKTAERVILELREKLQIDKPLLKELHSNEEEEVISVLKSLGISKNDASERIRLAKENGFVTTEEILNYCLKNS
ncbi:MAG: Holliday junction branch migration protein RuvA [Clostridia bacterium]